MSLSGFAAPSFLSPLPSAYSTNATISLLIELITQLIHALTLYIQSSSVTPTSLPSSPLRKSSTPYRPFVCVYCSDSKHLIKACPLVTSDIRAGLCQRNPRGRVVLPSGLYVPHSVPGPNLRNRIVTCLRQNPNAARSPLFTPSAAAPCPAVPPSPSSSNSTVLRVVPATPALSPSLRTPTSSTVDPDKARIAEIEREIATLRARCPAVSSTPSSEPLQPTLSSTSSTLPAASSGLPTLFSLPSSSFSSTLAPSAAFHVGNHNFDSHSSTFIPTPFSPAFISRTAVFSTAAPRFSCPSIRS
ncbi:Transposon Tf2-12 polyprotein [Mycena venus]|uniref:Transposon Tf2-12 polyprotein n=1 Tax=Mycena venus TaxID=2733690 RepID=A0A8H7DH37_9AGAR|nr:Transposon Tf2-12 polyprotein [Mycena venus]